MKKSIILAMTWLGLGSSLQIVACAQPNQGWDLGPIQNANPMLSGGAGLSAQAAGRQNLTPGYPYVGVPNAMPVNTDPAMYNKLGDITGRYPASQQMYMPSQIGRGALAPAYMSTLDRFTGPGGIGLPHKLRGKYNGLPPTTLDSFVRNAGGAASHIYGDEGTYGWPPQNGFSEADTINAGITGMNNKSITTGHGSRMPAPSQVDMYSPSIPMTKSGAR